MTNAKERRRRGIINAIASKYGVLIDPELLDALLSTRRDPIQAVGEALSNMREDEIVLNIGHFEVY